METDLGVGQEYPTTEGTQSSIPHDSSVTLEALEDGSHQHLPDQAKEEIAKFRERREIIKADTFAALDDLKARTHAQSFLSATRHSVARAWARLNLDRCAGCSTGHITAGVSTFAG